MQRRTLFKWTLAVVPHVFLPRWVFAQAGRLAPNESAMLRALAGVVLPASLGASRLEAAVGAFEQWVREYRAGAEMSAGYGITRLQVIAPDPSADYTRQLRDLEASAQAKGATFARLDRPSRSALVASAIEGARVDALPRRPDGRHIATDLMSHFFFINDAGQDWLYNAAIERAACRGLASSGERPRALVPGV